MSPKVATRFMIISDTHCYDFDEPRKVPVPFQHPLPEVDVLLHCGDLTRSGAPSELRGVIKMLASIKAELKLVIAGNHDLTLDEPYWRKTNGSESISYYRSDSEERSNNDEEHTKAMEIMTGKLAIDAGVVYLEEGVHSFTLKNGARFTVYASPYQPEFCGFAFPYLRTEDRYNPEEYVAKGVKPIDGVKVPDFPGVDIMMTHGPPHGILDAVDRGRAKVHVGCEALMTAVSRARPLMYCFGHIHEGHGAEIVSWNDSRQTVGANTIAARVQQQITYPQPFKPNLVPGMETLMVNAAIMDVRYRPVNSPWVIDLELSTDELLLAED